MSGPPCLPKRVAVRVEELEPPRRPIYRIDRLLNTELMRVFDREERDDAAHPWVSVWHHPGVFPVYTIFTDDPEAFGFGKETTEP